MPSFTMADHGLRAEFCAPDHDLGDADFRRRAVLRSLELLRPLVRPLALEVTTGPLDPVTGAVTPAASRRVAVRAIPSGVAHLSQFEQPAPVELVDELTPDVVAEFLSLQKRGWDVATVTVRATAARIGPGELRIERAPSVRVPVLDMDGERWAVGPVDVAGMRLLPPVGLRWSQDWGELRIVVEDFWDLFWQVGSAEHGAFRAAERALDEAGFTPG